MKKKLVTTAAIVVLGACATSSLSSDTYRPLFTRESTGGKFGLYRDNYRNARGKKNGKARFKNKHC